MKNNLYIFKKVIGVLTILVLLLSLGSILDISFLPGLIAIAIAIGIGLAVISITIFLIWCFDNSNKTLIETFKDFF